MNKWITEMANSTRDVRRGTKGVPYEQVNQVWQQGKEKEMGSRSWERAKDTCLFVERSTVALSEVDMMVEKEHGPQDQTGLGP